MRYAEKWIKVDIGEFNLEKVLSWCTDNLQGKQFIEETFLKFDDEEEAAKFRAEYKEI